MTVHNADDLILILRLTIFLSLVIGVAGIGILGWLFHKYAWPDVRDGWLRLWWHLTRQ